MLKKHLYINRFTRSCTDFMTCLADVSLPGVATPLSARVQQLTDQFDKPALVVRVLLLDDNSSDFRQKLISRLALPETTMLPEAYRSLWVSTLWDTQPVEVHLISRLAASFSEPGGFPGHLSVVAFGQTADNLPDALAFAMLWAEGCVVLLHDQPDQFPALPTNDRTLRIAQSTYQPNDPILWQQKAFAEQAAILHTYNALLALDSLGESLQLLARQAERGVRVNKLLAQPASSASGRSVADQDVFAPLKLMVQQQFGQLEKNALDQLDAYFMPVTGRYWADVFPTIDSLSELETTAKAKINILRITEKATNLFLKQVKKEIHWNLSRSIEVIREGYATLERDMADYARTRKLPQVSPFFSHLTDTQLRYILESAVRIERPYEANTARKGWYEYAMAVRRYQMLFFMMASTFGLSFLRREPHFMIPASLVLVGYGIFSIRKTVQQERMEIEERELTKARDTLRDEARRIGNEAQGRWRRQLSEYVKTQQAQVIRQVDERAVAWQQLRQTETEEEQRRFRRQAGSYDATEKQLSVLNQNFRAWQRTQQSVKQELKNLFTALG